MDLCTKCQGRGKEEDENCEKCFGTGLIPPKKLLMICPMIKTDDMNFDWKTWKLDPKNIDKAVDRTKQKYMRRKDTRKKDNKGRIILDPEWLPLQYHRK